MPESPPYRDLGPPIASQPNSEQAFSAQAEPAAEIASGRELQVVLLDEHRSLLARQTAFRLVSRILCVLNVGLLAFLRPFTDIVLAMAIALCLVVGLVWFLDERATAFKLEEIRKTLARRSYAEWQDDYIRYRQTSSMLPELSILISAESRLWPILTTAVGFLRFLLERMAR